MNKILDRTIEDGPDSVIIRLDAGNVSLIYRGNALWVDVNGRPACQIDLFHLTDANEDGEKYAQIVLEDEYGADPVGYHRLLAQGNLVCLESPPFVNERKVDWDQDGKYYG